MSSYAFSNEEIAEVKVEFPNLDLVKQGVWRGTLTFDRVYREYRIADEYEVEIEVPKDFPDTIPRMSEMAGRTEEIAKKYNLGDIRDLHKNTHDGTACLCVKQVEREKVPPGSTVCDFINALVIPYLYGLSYFEEQGKWPWKDYGHGFRGLVEFYADDLAPQKKRAVNAVLTALSKDADRRTYLLLLLAPSMSPSCVCGSSKSLKECHPNLWIGTQRLRSDMDRHGLLSALRRIKM